MAELLTVEICDDCCSRLHHPRPDTLLVVVVVVVVVTVYTGRTVHCTVRYCTLYRRPLLLTVMCALISFLKKIYSFIHLYACVHFIIIYKMS